MKASRSERHLADFNPDRASQRFDTETGAAFLKRPQTTKDSFALGFVLEISL